MKHFDLNNLIRCILICHDVLRIDGKLSGSSQDELVLIEEIENNHGAKFVGRDAETITISIGDKIEVYKIIKIYEFTSDRKMMSITVESPSGDLLNFAKGADVAFNGKMVPETPEVPEINEFANQGLRTLMFVMTQKD
jgi:magnesium-transporting ATPase (P-type)